MLLAAAEALGIDTPLIPRIATPFGGGVGRQGEVCGAVTGALMAVGLARGRNMGEDQAVKGRVYEVAAHLMHRFEARFGALRCRDLIGLDWSQPDSLDKFHASGLWDRCVEYVATAVTILEELDILPTSQNP